MGHIVEIDGKNSALTHVPYPAGTRRNNNVFITSTRHRRRRVDVVKTLSFRHYCVMCPLGSGAFMYRRTVSSLAQIDFSPIRRQAIILTSADLPSEP